MDPFLKGLEGGRDSASLHDSVVDSVMGPSQHGGGGGLGAGIAAGAGAGAFKPHHARENSTTSMYTPLLVDEDPFAAARPRATSPGLTLDSPPTPTPRSYGLPPGAASAAPVLPSSRDLDPGFLAAPNGNGGLGPMSPNSPAIQPGYHASLASRSGSSSSSDSISPPPQSATPVKPSPLAQVAAKAPSSTGHSSSSHIGAGPSTSRTSTPTRAHASRHAGTSSPPPKITWLEGPSEASLGSFMPASRAASPSGGLGIGMSTSSVNLGDPRLMSAGLGDPRMMSTGTLSSPPGSPNSKNWLQRPLRGSSSTGHGQGGSESGHGH